MGKTDPFEEFNRKREELRKQREALFSAHEANMKHFDGEAKRIQTKREAFKRVEMVKLMRQKPLIDSEKLVRQRPQRASLERFKTEIGVNEVRGLSHNSGRVRKLHDSTPVKTRQRTAPTRTMRTTAKRSVCWI